MPKSPDFDQIARALDAELDDSPAGLGGRFLGARLAIITEQLRLVWNARGAADADAFAGDQDHRDILERIKALDR